MHETLHIPEKGPSSVALTLSQVTREESLRWHIASKETASSVVTMAVAYDTGLCLKRLTFRHSDIRLRETKS